MKNYINDILEKLNIFFSEGTYLSIEHNKIELKDLSTGNDWRSLKETVCAFLNTDGGIIIAGIRESANRKEYKLTGFDRNNESNLVRLKSDRSIFQSDIGTYPDLDSLIDLDYIDFRGETLAVIFVSSLPEDEKYLKFDGVYYERTLTQDRKIPETKIRQHQEYKKDLEYAKEITIIEDAVLKDICLDKINYYITLWNREIKKERLKPSLAEAKSFLERQHFIRKNQVTTLGILVCGDDPFHFLENRVAVDCFFDTGTDIARDKKLFRDDVLTLMENTFKYVWSHIKVGRSVSGGGSSSPEYPEELIREVINNALAHRDYRENNFITVTIKPDEYFQIRNPGSFKEKLFISCTEQGISVRRIKPGIPETKNPKLASVLKVFDKVESRGRGMATLLNACLSNQIDLPFYQLIDENTISLTIPSGKLVDEYIEMWLSSFRKYIHEKLFADLTFEQKAILAYFFKSEKLNNKRCYTILLSQDNNHFEMIDSLLTAKLIFEHHSGDENYPVYLVDRELVKDNFSSELQELFGPEFSYLNPTAIKILNIIYRHSHYNGELVTARQITHEMYNVEIGKKIDPRKVENMGRKVRYFCRELVKKKYLITSGKGQGYNVNYDYQKPNSLFNKKKKP